MPTPWHRTKDQSLTKMAKPHYDLKLIAEKPKKRLFIAMQGGLVWSLYKAGGSSPAGFSHVTVIINIKFTTIKKEFLN